MKRKSTIKDAENMKKSKGITLIALVITIIVLLILAGVSIATLTGQNGILTQANNSKVEQSHAAVREAISLAYNEWKIEVNTANNTKVASTETVTIQGIEEKTEAELASTFFDYLVSKEYVDETTRIINVEKLTGSKQSLGNGTDSSDVYKIEEDDNGYKVVYYDENEATTEISTIQKETVENNDPFSYTQADIDETLKYFKWIIVDVTEENREYYGYDESMVGKKVAIIIGTKEDYYTYGMGGTFPLKKIVIPKSIEGSDYVDINCSLAYLDNLETIIYLNNFGTFETNSCRDLITLKMPEEEKIIGREIFRYCSKLTNVRLPQGLQEIEVYAFGFCKNLTELKIPNTVTNIGQRTDETMQPFYNCPNLTITVEAGSPLTIEDFENTGIDTSKVIFE